MDIEKREYAYYPGCSLEGMAKEFDIATKEVFTRLGIKLSELADWSCCGATAAHYKDRLLAYALPARNLNLVGKSGKSEVAISCAACFSRLKTTTMQLEHDSKLKAEVELVLEEKYEGGVKPLHILEILMQSVGTARLQALVTKPLKSLRVVSYYGCLLVRPPEVATFDDLENPTSMDKIMECMGAVAVDWPMKTECCGASLTLSKSDWVLNLVEKLLREAKDAKAQVIAVACPLCQANLDMRQIDLQNQKRIDFKMPVLYFTQLMALAMGAQKEKLSFHRHLVEVQSTLGAYLNQ
ncbi:MAG: CoB--CoM heterodisulfide reductase iron-sulfur subunit B family protein [Oligoflexia bacterium]|nr:CoB--CoM heterodisulfide reductase iron-sulfur subunit B family protein [Oligoflexia bacterium]